MRGWELTLCSSREVPRPTGNRRCRRSGRAAKARPALHAPFTALRASESSLHLAHLTAPPAPLTEFRDLPRLNDGHTPTSLAIDAEHVAVPMVVANGVEALAAHGLRLTDQMRAERAVISAASARTAAGSRINIACLPTREGHPCSLIVPNRTMVFAACRAWQRQPTML